MTKFGMVTGGEKHISSEVIRVHIPRGRGPSVSKFLDLLPTPKRLATKFTVVIPVGE